MRKAFARLRRGGEDSTRSWLIAVGGFTLYFVFFGVNRVSGVLFKALLSDDNTTSREQAAWPFTLGGAAIIYAGPMASFLEYRFSSQTVIYAGILLSFIGYLVCYFSTNIVVLSVFFGVLRGTGMSMATNFVPGHINNNFKRHRSTGMGIATTGTPAGGLVLPLLVEYCLITHGLHTTFLILAGLTACAFLGAALIIEQKKPVDDGEDTQGNDNRGFDDNLDTTDSKTPGKIQSISQNVPPPAYTKNPDDVNLEETCRPNIESKSSKGSGSNTKKDIVQAIKSIFKTRGFYFIAAANVSSAMLAGFYGMVIVDYAVDKGVSERQGVLILTINSGSEIAGRLFLGWITDRGYISKPNFLALSMCVTATLVLLLSFAQSYVLLLTYAALFGITQGASVSAISTIFSEYIERKHMHLAVSFSRSAIGLSHLPRAVIVGYFRDHLGSYDHLFHILAGILYLVTVIWIGEGLYRSCLQKPKPEETENPKEN